ncbi:MAG: hypothetical protein M1824_005754 [Vezdaea acicularis]|nr:MAG: hypothetical protein M1824_005754 [Vezdaea acicularis]
MADAKSSASAPTMTPPIPYTRMKQISQDACNAAFENVEFYEHSRSAEWNSAIVNHILKHLISESSTPTSPPSYKYAVNSTIIQHLTPSAQLRKPTTTTSSTGTGPEGNGTAKAAAVKEKDTKAVGRRGMHSATGAYWNNERDGMWSFKYEGGEGKGLDVVVNVVWMSMS